MINGIIYIAINRLTNKCYVGQTVKKLNIRICEHISSKEDYYFHRSIRKYDNDNFIWIKVCDCHSKEHLNECEKYYINLLDTKVPNGYNLTDGGEGTLGWKPTDEQLKKMRDVKIGKPGPWKNKKRPDISKKMSGKNHPSAGLWEITLPDGSVKIIKCLKIFCDENNLNYNSIRAYLYSKIKRPHYKNYTFKILKDIK